MESVTVHRAGWRETLAVFLKLGFTSFGGPIAHLGYFRDEFVVRRRWLADSAYADLVALRQFLPGPASSQVGIAIGITRAGLLGGQLAWIGFTLPSAIALAAFGLLQFWKLPPWGVVLLHALAGAGMEYVAPR